MTQTPIQYVTAPPAGESDVPVDRSWWESLEHDRGPGGFPVNANSEGLANQLVAKSGAGLLFGFTVYNSKASTQYVMVFDLQGIVNLSASSVPRMTFPVLSKQTITVGWANPWRAFKQGIILANSTADTSFTQGLADCTFDVQYA